MESVTEYLGSLITVDGKVDAKIPIKIKKAKIYILYYLKRYWEKVKSMSKLIYSAPLL